VLRDDLQAGGVDARQVEREEERVTSAVTVHRHRLRDAPVTEDLLGQAADVSVGIESEQHCCITPFTGSME